MEERGGDVELVGEPHFSFAVFDSGLATDFSSSYTC